MIRITTRHVCLALAAASAGLVLGSLVLTAWLDRHPCHLCIFQRLLFMIIALLALAAVVTPPLPRRIMCLQERRNLYTRRRILDWIGRQGVDADGFGGIFDSFAVRTRLNQGDQMVRDYAVDAVPMIAVDGRYKPKLAAGKGFKDLLDRTDQLIELARRDRQ